MNWMKGNRKLEIRTYCDLSLQYFLVLITYPSIGIIKIVLVNRAPSDSFVFLHIPDSISHGLNIFQNLLHEIKISLTFYIKYFFTFQL